LSVTLCRGSIGAHQNLAAKICTVQPLPVLPVPAVSWPSNMPQRLQAVGKDTLHLSHFAALLSLLKQELDHWVVLLQRLLRPSFSPSHVWLERCYSNGERNETIGRLKTPADPK
jgi:hypothetical protein